MLPKASEERWTYHLPDLAEGGEWYQARVRRLREVITELNGPEKWYTEGLELLRCHRQNYGPDGPVSLVVLWWEWSSHHWEELREGASMNFLATPVPGLVENSKMDADQAAAAEHYVDELRGMGVFEPASEPVCPPT